MRPPQPPKKPTFLKITNFQEDFQYFLGGHGFHTFCKVLKYIGENGFIIFWTKNGHFLREHNLTYIFDPATNRVNSRDKCMYLLFRLIANSRIMQQANFVLAVNEILA